MSNSSHRRLGFTLVELLVVITIIGMLVALLLPAVNAARERMLTAQCLNNMQQVGKAMVNYSTTKGTLPGYVQPVQRQDKTYVQLTPDTSMSNASYSPVGTSELDRVRSRISWAARILVQMERNDMWDRIVDVNTPAGDPVRPMGAYICPKDSDAKTLPDNAALSYVVNAGAWDWNASGLYVGDAPANGLFHNLSLGRTTSRIDNIKDGASTTLMLSENIHKNGNYSWMGVGSRNATPVPAEFGGEQHFGMVWVVNLSPGSNLDDVGDQARFKEEGNVTFRSDMPWYARPSSNHPGGAMNVIFADGNGRPLQPEIDYQVYQALLTPYGSKCVDPLDPSDVSGPIGAFRARPPLSERDYE
ncbi:MAG: DUF1559 domain-containing protein [Pirellulales bacterium]